MSKVAIITDSTVNLPENLAKGNSITVLPQVLIWAGETYEDGVDISPSEFYDRLKDAKQMPSTSQVTPKSFLGAYRKLLDENYEILSILIAEKLSGTIASAIQAKESFPNAPIEIVDAGTTSLAMGFVVLMAAEAAKKGASLQECKELAEKVRQYVGVVFAVDTLEFLHRGGRIGGGSRFLGTALNIKPILEVVDGRVEAVERVRTRSRSLTRLVELVQERVGDRKPVRLAALHANAREDALELLNQASNSIDSEQTILSEVSPVIGTHAGPGTVGLAWMAGM
jgi:fatty acid kinase fatty acid binding subunit